MENEYKIVSKDKLINIFAIIAIISATFFATTIALPAPDLWWQLSVGRYFHETGKILQENIFSYTSFNTPVIDHEWLAEILFYKLYLLGGLDLLYLLKSSILSVIFSLLYILIRKKYSPIICSASCILAIFTANFQLFSDVRPYLFTYLFFAITILSSEILFEKDSKYIFCLIPIVWLWANLHAGYMLFFAIALIYLFAKILEEEYSNFKLKAKLLSINKQKDIFIKTILEHKNLIITSIISFGLIFINPFGAKLALYPFSFSFSNDQFFKEHLTDWSVPDFLGQNLTFTIYLIFIWIGILIYRKRLSIFNFLMLIAFSYLACSAVRHITLFAILSPIYTSIIISDLDKIINKIKDNYNVIAIFLTMIIFLFLASFRASNLNGEKMTLETELFPKYGVEFIKANKFKGNISHPYGWGGYLIWKLYPANPKEYRVFIDGRATVAYNEDIYRKALMIDFGSKYYEQYLNEYNVNLVLCSKYFSKYRTDGKNLCERLFENQNWYCLIETPTEFIFIRNNKENKEIIEKSKKGLLEYPELR